MREIKMTVYVKEGKEYKVSRYRTDENAVHFALMEDLINKKICNCTYIKRITRYSNHDGTQTIKVYYNNGVMREYIVENNI